MASELSHTQRQILAAAAQRNSGLVLPVTSKLKGRALKKVLSALLTRGAIEEVPADGEQEVWRTNDEGVALTLSSPSRSVRPAARSGSLLRSSRPRLHDGSGPTRSRRR
jgi:hypothetical protein